MVNVSILEALSKSGACVSLQVDNNMGIEVILSCELRFI
jgi:hypothetical protein